MVPRGLTMKWQTLAATALVGALAAPSLPARAQAPAPSGAATRAAAPGSVPAPGAMPLAPPADLPAEPFVVPTGTGTELPKHLTGARPTVFVFTRGTSTLERRFLQQVCRDAGRRAGVGVLKLTTGLEPAAKKYEIN